MVKTFGSLTKKNYICIWKHQDIYISSKFFKYSPYKTILSLFPLPKILIFFVLKFISFNFILTNSLTLIPVEYKSSNITLSLWPKGVLLSGIFKIVSSSFQHLKVIASKW